MHSNYNLLYSMARKTKHLQQVIISSNCHYSVGFFNDWHASVRITISLNVFKASDGIISLLVSDGLFFHENLLHYKLLHHVQWNYIYLIL
jgi:hypothetical protein